MAQDKLNMPYDFSRHQGYVINNGSIMWNEDWSSGNFFFDGTFSNYPSIFGPQIESGYFNSTIDSTLYEEFLNLCIAYCLNWIGKIRKKYNNVNTPFGTIDMNADEMINEARELKRDTIDKLMRTPQEQLVWVI